MVTMTRWLAKWRTVADDVEDGFYVPITVELDGRSFEVLRVSKFDTEIDGPKNGIQTTSSAFEDRTALFSHITRDTGLIRVVTTKGRPWFILEPGEEVLEWLAAVEGVALATLVDATRAGALWRGIARAVKLEKKRRQLTEAQVAELKYHISEAEDEANQLRRELRLAEKELARLGAE